MSTEQSTEPYVSEQTSDRRSIVKAEKQILETIARHEERYKS